MLVNVLLYLPKIRVHVFIKNITKCWNVILLLVSEFLNSVVGVIVQKVWCMSHMQQRWIRSLPFGPLCTTRYDPSHLPPQKRKGCFAIIFCTVVVTIGNLVFVIAL